MSSMTHEMIHEAWNKNNGVQKRGWRRECGRIKMSCRAVDRTRMKRMKRIEGFGSVLCFPLQKSRERITSTDLFCLYILASLA